jgi:hypothetical protein
VIWYLGKVYEDNLLMMYEEVLEHRGSSNDL